MHIKLKINKSGNKKMVPYKKKYKRRQITLDNHLKTIITLQ